MVHSYPTRYWSLYLTREPYRKWGRSGITHPRRIPSSITLSSILLQMLRIGGCKYCFREINSLYCYKIGGNTVNTGFSHQTKAMIFTKISFDTIYNHCKLVGKIKAQFPSTVISHTCSDIQVRNKRNRKMMIVSQIDGADRQASAGSGGSTHSLQLKQQSLSSRYCIAWITFKSCNYQFSNSVTSL